MRPTRDHEQIRQWAERNDGSPAEIRRLPPDGAPPVLTFIFDLWDAGRPFIYPISWENFFAHLDALELSISFDEGAPAFDIVRVESMQEELSH